MTHDLRNRLTNKNVILLHYTNSTIKKIRYMLISHTNFVLRYTVNNSKIRYIKGIFIC